MLEELYKDSEIREFLLKFPKEQWNTCVHLSMVYGIRQLMKENFNFKLNLLQDYIYPPKNYHRKNKKSSQNVKVPSYLSPKSDPSLITVRKHYDEKGVVQEKRYSSPPIYGKIEKNGKGERSRLEKNDKYGKKNKAIPKYLRKVQSKIKSEVQKDFALHTERNEIINSLVYDRKNNKSMPNLMEVIEPNTCPIDKLKKIQNINIGELAEQFLSSPLTRVLSPYN